MGIVYVAEDTHLHRRVAIKFLASSTNLHHRSRFLREARAVSALSHGNIASIYDYGETSDGQPFIVMELVSGQTLNELIAESALTLSRAVEIIAEVAEALDEAHRMGIVHRDIKPSNIILDARGQAKVLDFGLAKQLSEAQDGYLTDPEAPTLLAATRTQSGMVIGTPLYLSPEQAMGARVDARSDIFALGALLYECIAGRPAFSGTSVIEIGAQVIHVNPLPPSKFNSRVPKELDRITLKALAKKPEARYQSAADMLADLRAARAALDGQLQHHTRWLSSTSGASLRTSALLTVSEGLRRPRLSLASFVVALAVAALCLWGVLWLKRPAAHVATAEAQRWYDKGVEAMRDGSYDQASKALQQAVNADDQFALGHARLAEAWMELDYTDRAKDETLRAKTLVPDPSALSLTDALYLDGITSTVTRDYKKAVAAYSEVARQMPDKPQAYVDLGRAYEKNENIKKAIDSYVEATNRDPQYATAYLRVGYLYGRQQDLASAIAAFTKAETLYQALGNIEGQTEVLYQRGFLLDNIGKTTDARAALQQALELSRATSNQYQQVKTLLKLSDVAADERNITQAQSYTRDAVEIAQANGIDNLTTRGLLNLGNVFLGTGDYNEAEKYFRQALELSRRQKIRRSEARALISLGSVSAQQNKPEEAVRYIEQALPFYQQGNYRKETLQSLLLLARAAKQKGDYPASLRALQSQLQLAGQIGDQSQVAAAQEEIGDTLVREEQYAEALSHFDESFAINKSLGIKKAAGYPLLGRSAALWQLGRYEEARATLDQVSALAEQSQDSDKQLTAFFYVTNARMALSERRFPEAKAKSQRVIGLTDTQSINFIVAKWVFGLTQALSGAAREGKLACAEAFDLTQQHGDNPWLFSHTALAFAETLLESGDAVDALEKAARAEEIFERAGQLDSEWRALLIQARATQRTGDTAKAREYAARANDVLSQLQQKWGAVAFDSYLTRPDIQFYRKQLGEIPAANQ